MGKVLLCLFISYLIWENNLNMAIACLFVALAAIARFD